MAPSLLSAAALVAAMLLLSVTAQNDQCSCSGLDYVNGGSYLIDGGLQSQFTFNSIFTGCPDGFITPILVDPSGSQFKCSEIETQPDGSQQSSQW